MTTRINVTGEEIPVSLAPKSAIFGKTLIKTSIRENPIQKKV